MFEEMGRFIVLMGVILVFIGLIFMAFEKFSIPQNPLDFHFKWKGIDVYFPLGTSILISIGLTLLLNLVIWLFIWLTKR